QHDQLLEGASRASSSPANSVYVNNMYSGIPKIEHMIKILTNVVKILTNKIHIIYHFLTQQNMKNIHVWVTEMRNTLRHVAHHFVGAFRDRHVLPYRIAQNR
ncbi:hypothetical protein ACJX0J_027266, partial [Zea mays]